MVDQPRLPQFRTSSAAEVEKARSLWIYESGRLDQHENWIAALTGKGLTKKEEVDNG